jgi:hypothetical protein
MNGISFANQTEKLIFTWSQINPNDNGPCHVSGIPLQKRKNPFCKGEKRRCLAGE